MGLFAENIGIWPTLITDLCGVRINLADAYRCYVEGLGDEDKNEWAKASAAILWWDETGLVGWWRHHVTRLFKPDFYAAMESLVSRGKHMRRQALLDAVLEAASVWKLPTVGNTTTTSEH